MNYYEIKIEGKDVKGFIRNLYKMGINLYDIKYNDKIGYIKVNKKDYEKIKKIKTIYKISICKYYGYIWYKEFILKYKLFLFILSIGLLLLILLTNMIFDISVKTNNKKLEKIIIEELKSNKISKYRLCVSFNKKEKIKESILSKYKDKIEWLEIKRIGTKYIIEVEERKKKESNNDYTPRDVIASKNGIITKINSTSGEVVGRIGEYVKKGDILISGSIHKTDDVVATIRADGKVFAETWYTVTVLLPYHYNEEIKTGKSKNIINIKFLNKNYSFNKLYKNYNEKNIFSIKNFLLPISISFSRIDETKLKEDINTIDYAFFKASSLAKDKLRKSLGNNIEIIFEKHLKTSEINSKIEVVIFYKVIEDITSYQDIKTVEENKEIR